MPTYFQSETYMRQIRKQGGLDSDEYFYFKKYRFQKIMKLVGDDLQSFRGNWGEVTMTLAI